VCDFLEPGYLEEKVVTFSVFCGTIKGMI